MMLIGVDPHKSTHTATAVEPGTNTEIASIRIDATLREYRRMLTWASRWPQRRWAIENAEGLGRHLASWLLARGEHVELEVTETAIMTDPLRARAMLERLSALGIRLSLDDFGAGYTSLSQRTSLPIDEIKIDRSFVMTMAEEPSNALIVRSLVDLGHSLGLTLVAEGVETEGVLQVLAALGCDVAQGYHLSHPIPVAALDTWCADRLGSMTGTR